MKETINIKTVLIVILAMLVIGSVVHIYNIKTLETLSRKKINLLVKSKKVKSEIEDLLIKKQNLLAQDRINKIATEKLGLVPNKEVNEVITIDGRELKHIQKIVKSKYE